MGGSSPSMPEVAPAPTPPPVVAPISADQDAARAGDNERKRRLAASGRSDTILTGGLGDTGTATAGGKKLLGE
ncbi:hypothetical protein [Desulfovibrio litoralis]|nr:hypothetical protein [Desulfovibrio litoralis]